MASEGKKAGGGSVGAIVTTAIGVYLGNSAHPLWATALYVLAVLSALYAALQLDWIHRLLGFQPISTTPLAHVNASVSSGRDNNGSQFAAQNSQIYGTDALNALLSKKQENSSPPAPEWPRLHWNFRYAKVAGSNGIWRESQSRIGYQSLLLDISALAPKRGTRTRNCTLYGAIRLFGTDPRNSRSLNRLCWIGERANEMDFEIGKSATLFVLCFEPNLQQGFNPEWATFQNPLNRVPDHPFIDLDMAYGPFGKKVALPVDGTPTFTVSLVDPYSSHTVDAKTVRLITSGEEDWRVEEVKHEE